MTRHDLASHEPHVAFEKPWHGQVFVLAAAMNEAGYFTWSEWAQTFGETLGTMREGHTLDSSEEYYLAWVTTLERLMVEKQIVRTQMLEEMKMLWTEAYLHTPHGKSVIPKLPKGLQTQDPEC